MSKKYDVSAICNALVDIIVEATDEDISKLNLNKGTMHLVEASAQKELFAHFETHQKAVELGGSAMNAIRALALLGKKTTFTGCISNDVYGNMITSRMNELGIHPHLGVREEETGTCVILVTPDGERTMVTSLAASRLYDKSHIVEEDIKESKVLHFCGYQWDTDNQKEAIEHAINIAKSNASLISFDIADPFVVNMHKKDFVRIVEEHADIVFANEEEAKLLYGLSPEETAQKIVDSGAIAVIKLGAKGAFIQKGNEIFKIEPVKTTVVDTTAAGDMFAGGFLYGYTSELPLEKCGHMAASLASDVISRYGATLSDDVITKVKL